MPDAGRPPRDRSGAEEYALGTVGGEVAVHAGLALTIGAVVGVYVGHWAVFVLALFGVSLWIISGMIVQAVRQRPPDVSPAASDSHPLRRAA
ncbi:hypothetical protein [Rhodococcus tibetensis]|uniref:Uncharacterized protein n=1 Tax=Rhodococcus tibetensis TaxID=2965064 RepID=A0ABT1QH98_9NOCA|nr:hypothetical protein [Rhodococcus sp. FXJ9.536]MCQ4120492.1 hypothetical protein [Rhodococcus sp. FXJ9.536]